jgi:trehalose-6-phosphate synthase
VSVSRFSLASTKCNCNCVLITTVGLPRPTLVAHYLAMDVGVVTPLKDGMNLVAKEMLVCNPKATLMLSTGAGTEVQFGQAGLYEQSGKQYYVRVEDLSDTEVSGMHFRLIHNANNAALNR